MTTSFEPAERSLPNSSTPSPNFRLAAAFVGGDRTREVILATAGSEGAAMKTETNPNLPTRNFFGLEDGVPEGVDLAVTVGPWWTVVTVDQVWSHVAAMHEEWSDPAGGPGYWVPLPDGQARLIVTSRSDGRRHPELADTRHADAGTAMRAAWDAGLLGVIVFPGMRERHLGRAG